MKKHFILGIMALAALASCTKSEVLNQESLAEKGISFSAYAGKAAQTKAQTITSEIAGEQGIGILAWRGTTSADVDETILNASNPVFMNNMKLTYDDANSVWTYSPTRYWPSTGAKVSFFAYAPWAKGDGTDTGSEYHPQNIKFGPDNDGNGGQHIITLEVPRLTAVTDENQTTTNVNNGVAYASQTDFLVADLGRSTNQNLNKSHEGDVTFQMKHALSKISLWAKAGGDGTTTNPGQEEAYSDGLVKVIFDNVKVTGTFMDKGQYNMFTEKWGFEAGQTDNDQYNFTNAAGTSADPFTAIADELYNGAAYADLKVDGNTEGWYYLNDPDYDLMVIPFAGNDDVPATITEVSGTYRVVTYQRNAAGELEEITDYTDAVDFKVAQNITLEAGKHYIFKFNVKLKEITFDVEIDDWTSTEIDIVDTDNLIITDSYNVPANITQQEYENLLGAENLAKLPWNADTQASLPWLVVETTATPLKTMDVDVESPSGQTWDNLWATMLANEPDGKLGTIVTVSAPQDLSLSAFEPGAWKVTINGKTTIINIPEPTQGI